VRDYQTGEDVTSLKLPAEQFANCLAVSPDSQLVAIGTSNHKVAVLDTSNGNMLHLYEHLNQMGHVECVAFSHDSTRIASGLNNSFQVFEARTGKKLFNGTGHSKKILSIAFSPNGKWLASGSEDGEVLFWNAETRFPFMKIPSQKWANANKIVFSPDSQRVYVNRVGIRMWEMSKLLEENK
jgi:WD40 repeat protein